MQVNLTVIVEREIDLFSSNCRPFYLMDSLYLSKHFIEKSVQRSGIFAYISGVCWQISRRMGFGAGESGQLHEQLLSGDDKDESLWIGLRPSSYDTRGDIFSASAWPDYNRSPILSPENAEGSCRTDEKGTDQTVGLLQQKAIYGQAICNR